MVKYCDIDTLRFILYDVHDTMSLIKSERFSEFDQSMFDMIIQSAFDWSQQKFYPHYREMDENPAVFIDGKVRTHPILRSMFEDAGSNGWLGMYMDAKHGGMQVPYTIANAFNHIIEAANNHMPGYLGLTTGAANLIASFGKQSLIDAYVPMMLSGKWGGTMALTEPQSGSSLSDLTTSATPTDEEGTYLIKGQKIFISGGDHEGVDNIVHLTLARIHGAPQGTKGISLFVVPRYLQDAERNLVDNHVVPIADFQKMGQKGYSTLHLVYGESGPCKGFLVGEAHQGLKYMFQMMNGARIDVGMTATSTAMAAYYASLQYAQERKQGKKIVNEGEKNSNDQCLIIEHADVRRMLLSQKAVIEGSLSLLFECSILHDLSICGETAEERHEAHMLLELLTPMAKSYPSEAGRDSINNGLQILGGYGFCNDFPLQQYLRDIRIMAIYEGTTGIQGIDLLGRKVNLENGKVLMMLMNRVQKTLSESIHYKELGPYSKQLGDAIQAWTECHMHLVVLAQKGLHSQYLEDATIYLMMSSNIVIAYQWLKMAVVACRQLEEQKNVSFYQSKIDTMKFFYKYELPKTYSYRDSLMSTDHITTKMDHTTFVF